MPCIRPCLDANTHLYEKLYRSVRPSVPCYFRNTINLLEWLFDTNKHFTSPWLLLKAMFYQNSADRWLALGLEWIGALVVLFCSFYAILEEETSAGIAGLTVSYALNVTQVVVNVIFVVVAVVVVVVFHTSWRKRLRREKQDSLSAAPSMSHVGCCCCCRC